jgi:hypothetical protein
MFAAARNLPRNSARLALAAGAVLLLSHCKKSGTATSSSPEIPKTSSTPVSLTEKVDFNRDVRPILSDRCFACHGPDANKGREAGLRLDTFEGATAELESGNRAIVPGDVSKSTMVARMRSHDPDEIMPPPKLDRPLSDAERSILERWIEQGAEYQPHWAFVTPKKHTPPAVKNTSWPSDDIDRFILSKIESANLEPNPPADPATLLRRAHLTLTGLPPTPQETEAFLKDPSPTAYEKQIDALLASPRYGERMAQDWLDLARFADTYGYQSDNPCFVWPYRDWVIKAYNENLPFDQFATWQIAGDLLPNPTQEQKLATLFNRLHRQTQEGGSIAEEFRHEYVSDRVHTYGTAFLGLTMECSKCHDHKYDPISQREYFSMASMFGQIEENGLYPYSISTTAPEPSMHLMEPHHPAEVEKRRAALDSAEKHLASLPPTREAAFETWLASTPNLQPATPAAHYPLDSVEENKAPNLIPNIPPASISGGTLKVEAGPVNQAVEFDGDTTLQLDGVNGGTRHDPISISLRIFCPDTKDRALILHSGPAMYSQSADASGFELLLEKGKLRWSCIHLWPGCAASIETTQPFPLGKWINVTATYDGSSSANGLKLFFDGYPAETSILKDHLDKQIINQPIRVGARPRDDRGFAQGRIDELQVFRRVLTHAEATHLAGTPLDTTFQSAKTGNPSAKQLIREFYLTHIDPEITTARNAVLAARKSLYDDYLDHIPLIMCMEESPYLKQFYVLERGDYASPDLKQPVDPDVPAAVMPFPKDAPRNRLGLAKWTVDPNNPLTPRLVVNRLWMMTFGNGIVETQENFGLQGDAPSHQELLDTLSRDFVDSGWDTKKFLKRLVLTSAFRQSSSNSEVKRQIDPKNRLLSRGPTYRLPAEAIRDQALLAAGLLVEKIGGPSVKPWQPPGIWSEAGASGGDYTPDTGEGLYRRSLYTYRKRTAPPPNMMTLDAGSREICQARRLSTNTPLQPLVFLNDLGFFECARHLAKRVVTEKPENPTAQAEQAFRILTSRSPRPAEAKAIATLYSQQKAHYEKDLAAAKSVCGEENPHLAALTILCSTLLTADATITLR